MKSALILLAAVFFLSNTSNAEIIYLADGSIINGTIQQTEENHLLVQSELGLIPLEKSKVVKIVYSQASASNKEKNSKNRIQENIKQFNAPEQWYAFCAVGFGSFIPNSTLKESIKSQSLNHHNAKEVYFSGYFTGGVSFTLTPNLMLGPGFTYLITYQKDSTSSIKSDQFITSLFFSAHLTYFLNEALNGFYITLSPGLGFFILDRMENNASASTEKSRFSAGSKGGFGYALQLNHFDTAVLLGLEAYYLQEMKKNNNTAAFKDPWSTAAVNLYFGFIW